MRAVILDYRADEAIVNKLQELGYKVIHSMENKDVSPALAGHPDLQICKCSSDVYFCCPSCYKYYKDVLADYGVEVIMGETSLSSNYPTDIAYNVAWIGNAAVHNLRYTDLCIKKYFAKSNIDMINVSQGYSKCNICVVSNDAVITSDRGIYKALVAHGIDALLICEGHIDIFGWEQGFIGGASGRLDNNTLAFCGDISMHPDFEKIKMFCSKYNVDCISLSNKRLMDLGSVILVDPTSV